METSAESGSMSPARVKAVKLEPETDQSEMALVKEEAVSLDEEERMKEEWSDSTAGCGVSEAAMLADLYVKHEVKDELVLGPERPHRPVVAPAALYYRVEAPALVSPAAGSGVRRSCSVRLERLLVDAARRTCRVAGRTYKLRAAEPAHTPSAIAIVYQCHHCGQLFRNKSVLKKHVHTHSPSHNATAGDGLKRQQKLRNEKKLSRQSYMTIHTDLQTHLSFWCNHCDYKCRQKVHLQTHLMTHTDEKPFGCSHCDYKCRLKQHLQTHLMTHTDEKPFSCSHCDYKCRQKVQLQTHLMTHTDETPFSCSRCDYKCRRKENLQTHLLTHTDVKRFICSHCDFKCRSKGNLNSHLMIHTNEKPFSCSQCAYKCKRKSDLRSHLLTHGDKKPLSCSHCDFKCKSKAHLMTHTDEEPFRCSQLATAATSVKEKTS